MADISILFDWQVLLLISPTLYALSIFGYILWSDHRYYKKKERSANKSQTY